MGFPGQEYWTGLPFPSPGELPNPGIEPQSPAISGRFSTIWVTRAAVFLNDDWEDNYHFGILESSPTPTVSAMTLPLLHLWRRFTEKLYLVSVSLRIISPGTTSWHAYYGNALSYVLLICFPWRRCSMVKSSGEIEVFKKLVNVCFFFYWKASQTFHMLCIVNIQEGDMI